MTVAEMLGKISAAELTEWMAFFQLEPFGASWENILAALPTAMLANANRDAKKQRKPFDLTDFMLLDHREQQGLMDSDKLLSKFGNLHGE